MSTQCGAQPDTDLLIAQVDRHVARLRTVRGVPDIALAERLADCLRELIAGTGSACAADRARVRAAVRYFVLRRTARHDRLPVRSFAADQRVIADIARQLGRLDVAVAASGVPAAIYPAPHGPGARQTAARRAAG
ncbi:hypothetical protein [Spirilliplanes yamanashiensis]|uniref:Uncharacterized protein n=1 Tax=Spirilliplanes yamanashiensis TaxID=42233 RepID=A0A8J3Y4Z2_9ACTN|nr:hypothetical protein [Spirilliplanes yamanashiensis]MDP9819600.1 hypothetical protein [Spirilliplanes yamanashiensis]GIJ01579.1 hypothetical protein Sya03_09310 [Spirilliplanes yamanashiensis]